MPDACAPESSDQMFAGTIDWLLRFDLATDAIYEVERGDRRRKQLAIVIVLGVVFYNLYNFTSVYLMPDILWQSVFLRVALISPVSLVLAYLVLRVSPKMREALVLQGMIGAFALPVFLFWWTEAALGFYSFSELDLTLVFGGLVLGLRFRHMIVFAGCALSFMLLAILTKPSLPSVLAQTFVLQAFTAVCFVAVSNYVLERRRCSDFISTQRALHRADFAEDQTQRLQEVSRTDALTGLPNRRSLDEALNAAFAETNPTAVLMIDLDFFKQFNDTQGHPTGDVCLQQVSEAFDVVAQCHSVFVARFGGEEFTVLITQRSEFEVARIARDFLNTVRDLEIAHPGRGDALDVMTISIGGAMRGPAQDKTIAEVMHEADAALYQAKRRGRNRFEASADIAQRLVAQS